MAKTDGIVKLGPDLPENALKVEELTPEVILRAKMAGESGVVGPKMNFRDFLWIKKQNLNFPVVITERFG